MVKLVQTREDEQSLGNADGLVHHDHWFQYSPIKDDGVFWKWEGGQGSTTSLQTPLDWGIQKKDVKN